MKVFSLKKD